MLDSWILFPAVLALLCTGAGLALDRAAGGRLPGSLILPAGLAALIVVAQLATATAATAGFAVPLAVALTLAGLALGWRRAAGIDPWACVAAILAFAAFAAPVALAGAPTWAGYTALDDTATWFALVDRVLEHGRDLGGLGPSTYEATLALNLADGYPVGSLLPLGVAADLVGADVAWVFQPYLALLAALLALGLYALAGGLVGARPLRAAAAAIGAQAALLFGYALWGGVKEVAAAALLVAAAALLAAMLDDGRARAALPAAVTLAAIASALSPAGAIVWTAPIAAVALLAALAGRGGLIRGRQLAALALATAALTVPWLGGAGFLPPTSAPLTSESAQGNLAGALSPLQAAGVWPAGDFRLAPRAPGLTDVLAAVVGLAAVLALALAWRRRSPAALAAGAGVAVAATATVALGSPWVAAKGLAIASPVVLGLALAAIASVAESGWRRDPAADRRPWWRAPLAGLVGAAVAAAAVWSNLLAFGEVRLAPAERYAELERVGEIVAGRGPTLIPEYDPYAARHFLRAGDPESVSDLRRRPIPLRGGKSVPRGEAADLDALATGALLGYRTLVVRRSPLASRPPVLFRPLWRGEHYEVWERSGDAGRMLAHIPLGRGLMPAIPAPCADVLRAARLAGPRGRVAAVRRPELRIAPFGEIRLEIAEAGRYELWLAGSTPERVAALVDGEEAGVADGELSHAGQVMRLGEAELEPGSRIDIVRERNPLVPGTAAPGGPLGPLVLVPSGAEPRRVIVPASRAQRLCGQTLDWVAALRRR